MILKAPITCLGFAGLGFFLGLQWHSERIAILQERLDFKEEQRLDAERRLSSEQAKKLQSALGQTPSRIGIDGGSSPLTKQLESIFNQSGWSVQSTETVSRPVLRPLNDRDANVVAKALKDAGVEFQSIGGNEIAIGNPAN